MNDDPVRILLLRLLIVFVMGTIFSFGGLIGSLTTRNNPKFKCKEGNAIVIVEFENDGTYKLPESIDPRDCKLTF